MLILSTEHVPIKAWTVGVPFEAEAEAQLRRVAALPFIHKWVAVMPDVHKGIGATVGSVIATKGAIVPAAVGVDIGCGMIAQRTSLRDIDLPSDLRKVRSTIERTVPVGFGVHRMVPASVDTAWELLEPRYRAIVAKHPKISVAKARASLGTLGSGNHFI